MNAKQANQVSIRNYLTSIGISPVRRNKSSSFYLAPYREDKHPSLKVSHKENLWIDYGIDNKGGTLIDLVLQLNPHFNVSDAIQEILRSTLLFFSFHQQNSMTINHTKHEKAPEDFQPLKTKYLKLNAGAIYIYKLQKLGLNQAITDYLTQRGIRLATALPFCKEVYYTVIGQSYFGLGNQNDKGWSIRSEISTGKVVLPKDILITKEDSKH